MPPGLDPRRLAEVIVTRRDGHQYRGSAYRVTTTGVLTAAHVVADAVTIDVRFDADRPGQWCVPAAVAVADRETDLAVLQIEPPPEALPVEPVRYGALGDRRAMLPAHLAGFPWWKQRRDDGRVYRDLHHASGTVAVLSNRRSGTLEVTVHPPAVDVNATTSPWEGMSGAAVWIGDRIVGVVVEHHPREGGSRLTAIRIDHCLERAGTLRTLLGIPPTSALVDVVPLPARQTTHSGYLEQVRDIAPAGGLRGRDAELDELAAFCAGDRSYVWWQAGPWAGKSALLSTFVLNPPAGVDVVSFFVTGRLAAQSDSEAFTDALVDQLNALLGEDALPALAPAVRDPHRRDLLRRAAARSHADGRRLVLVVDGLDEDTGTEPGSRRASIASLLPKDPGDGLRIVLAGRPHPPIPDDVPGDHPLRTCAVRDLQPSPHARAIEHDATRELRRLLHGDQTQLDILGFITSSGGGLSQTDLAELTSYPPFVIEGTIRSAFGRTVARLAGTSGPIYLFAHDTLRITAQQQLGPVLLAGFRQRILAWADTYQADGWPRKTPAYLLDGYTRMLDSQGDVARLCACALDRNRHDRLLDATGGDVAALNEIRAAQDRMVAGTEPDLLTMAKLAIERERLAARNSNLPAELPAVWAALGYVDRGEALASSITDPRRQQQALAAVVEATASNGAYEQAAAVARAITDADQRAWALTAVVDAAASSGHYERATRVAIAITNPERRAWALVTAVSAAAATNDGDRTVELARLAVTHIGEPEQGSAKCAVVEAMTSIGRYDEAADLARTFADRQTRSRALGALAVAVGRAGRAADAADLAREVDDAEQRSWALALLAHLSPAPALAAHIENRSLQAGVVKTAVRAAMWSLDWDRADAIAQTIVDGGQRARVSTQVGVAKAISAASYDQAVSLARQIPDPEGRSAALCQVVSALVSAGQVDRAAAAIGDITDVRQRTLAERLLVPAATASGQFERAAALARAIPDPARRDEQLAFVAGAAASARALDTAIGIGANHPLPAPVLTALVRACGAQGRFDDAVSLAEPFTTYDRQAKALTAVVRIAAVSRRYAEGLSVAARIRDPEHRRAAQRVILAAVGRDGVAGLIDALEEGDRDEALAYLASRHAELGHLDAAAGFAAEVSVARVQELLMSAFGRSVAEAGRLELALPLIERSDQPAYRAGALASLADALIAAGHLEQARELVADHAGEYREAHVIPALVQAAAAKHRYDDALAYAREASLIDARCHHLLAVVRSAAAAGHFELASGIARDLDVPVWRAQGLTVVARALARGGRHDAAVALAAEITPADRQVWALSAVAATAAGAGWPEAARLALDVLPSAREISDRVWRAQALAHLVEVFVTVGDLTEACSTAEQIGESEYQTRALMVVFRACTAAGRFADLPAVARTLVSEGALGGPELLWFLHVLAEAGRVDDAEHLAVHVVDRRRESILEYLTAHGALWPMGSITPPRREDLAGALTAVVDGAVAGGHYRAAGLVAQRIRDPQQQAPETVAIVDAAIAAGDFDAAASTAQLLDDPDVRTQLIRSVVKSTAAVERYAEAVALTRRIDSPEWRSRVLTDIASAARTGEREQAIRLANVASAAAREVEHPHWHTRAITSLVPVLTRIGAYEDARLLAGKVSGSPEHVPLLETITRALVDAGHFELAVAVTSEIPDEALRGSVMLDVVKASAAAGEVGPALAAARLLPKQTERARAAIVETLAAGGAFDEAERVARAMTLEPRRSKAFTQLMTALAEAGQTGRAAALGPAEVNVGLDEAYAELVEIACAAGRFGEAADLAELIDADHVQDRARAELVRAMLAGAHTERTALAATLDEATAIAGRIRAVPAREVAVAALAKATARVGDYAQAFTLAADIMDQHWLANAVRGIVEVAAHAGVAEQVASMVAGSKSIDFRALVLSATVDAVAPHDQAAALALIDRIPDLYRRCDALVHLARVAAKNGDGATVRALVELAEPVTRKMPEEGTVMPIAVLAKALTAVDRDEQAVALIHGIAEPSGQAWALTTLAQSIAATGRYDRAEAVARTIDDPDGRTCALVTVASVASSAGDLTDSIRLADRASEAAGRIAKPSRQAWALRTLARVLTAAGRGEQAVALVEHVGDAKMRERIRNEITRLAADALIDRERTRHLVAKVTAAVDAGDHARATDLAQRIPDPEQQAAALTHIATALADAGQWSDAVDLAGSIVEPAARARAVAEVALRCADRPSVARRILAAVMSTDHWTESFIALPRVDGRTFDRLKHVLLAEFE